MDFSKLKKDAILKWYNCGPTIDNLSHIGHARTFIVFDMMRNYLEAKGYTILYATNITDINDKILSRAKSDKLYKKIQSYCEIIGKDKFIEKLPFSIYPDKLEQVVTHKQNYNLIKEIMEKNNQTDLELTNKEYFEYSKKMEESFWNDMSAIDVKVPNMIIRVSDCVSDIINYIQKIINNGYAYIINGSVYFDSEKYEKDGYKYKFERISENTHNNTEKKSTKDFALWKKNNDVYAYDSPWGKGIMGWHIECSTMIHKVFGETLDIHSGGIDLKFPHHNNEVAQTIAHNKNNEWCDIFLHIGHVNIKQIKMSKSLGNSISIRDFLKKYTSRQLRLLFLVNTWNKSMEYTDEIMNYVIILDNKLNNFIWHCRKKIKENNNTDANKLEIFRYINNKDKEISTNLNDNFNTRKAMNNIFDIIDNIYTNNYDSIVIEKAYKIIMKYLGIFRLTYDDFKHNTSNKLIDGIIEVRNKIRTYAKKNNELFILTDEIRDILREHNVGIKDYNDKSEWYKIN